MIRSALFAALLLAGCVGNVREELPPPPLPQRPGVDPLIAARAEGIEFRAVGDGFVVDIYRADRIRFTMTETGDALIFPKPEPRYPRWNGSIYETSDGMRTLTVQIRNDRPCERDDRDLYPITVHVRLGDRGLEGCGRQF